MTNEDSHLKAFVTKIHVEFSPIQEDNHRLFLWVSSFEGRS